MFSARAECRHCERSEAIQVQVADPALDRRGGKPRLAKTDECTTVEVTLAALLKDQHEPDS